MKFILRLTSGTKHDKAVVELTPEDAGVLLRLRDVFNAASRASPVPIDRIECVGPVAMRVVAVDEDALYYNDVRDPPPTVDNACVDPDAEVNWTEDELDFDEVRTEIHRVCVCPNNVRWIAYLRQQDTKLFSAYLPWEDIERVFSRSELP